MVLEVGLAGFSCLPLLDALEGLGTQGRQIPVFSFELFAAARGKEVVDQTEIGPVFDDELS